MSIDHSVTRSVLALLLSVSAGCVASDEPTSESGAALVDTTEAADADTSGIGLVLRPAVPSELNAFGCLAADLGVFAGRFSSIHVFADIASLGAQRRRVPARVVGRVSAGLPEVLSGAYITWDVAWLHDSDSMLLYGSALTPIGHTVVAQLPLPRTTGVYAAMINTTNMTTGALINDAVTCTVR